MLKIINFTHVIWTEGKGWTRGHLARRGVSNLLRPVISGVTKG